MTAPTKDSGFSIGRIPVHADGIAIDRLPVNVRSAVYVSPANQFPTGSRVYKGYQGSGKTLSMVKYAQDIVKKYPNCAIFSNIRLCLGYFTIVTISETNNLCKHLAFFDLAYINFSKQISVS